jgi:hypothetical protein
MNDAPQAEREHVGRQTTDDSRALAVVESFALAMDERLMKASLWRLMKA